MAAPYEKKFKLHLCGNSSVGKSSILLRFVHDVFDHESTSTVGTCVACCVCSRASLNKFFTGVDFKVKAVELSGKKVKLTIWDTGRSRPMWQRFLRISNDTFHDGHLAVELTNLWIRVQLARSDSVR